MIEMWYIKNSISSADKCRVFSRRCRERFSHSPLLKSSCSCMEDRARLQPKWKKKNTVPAVSRTRLTQKFLQRKESTAELIKSVSHLLLLSNKMLQSLSPLAVIPGSKSGLLSMLQQSDGFLTPETEILISQTVKLTGLYLIKETFYSSTSSILTGIFNSIILQ